MRKKVVAGNWKMHKTNQETIEFINQIKEKIDKGANEVILCVPYTALETAVNLVKGTDIKIGAQNMYYEDKGAFTGEIAPDMLKNIGVTHVILGHSERRAYFNETDETVAKKVKKALETNMIPIVCVGETLEDRENGITEDLIRIQTKIALKGLDNEKMKNIILAYEPIWAIGTGKTATNDQAQEVCKTIRETVKSLYGEKAGEEVRILYGGSVNQGNAKSLFAMPDIDGGLVGGASLKEEFIPIALA